MKIKISVILISLSIVFISVSFINLNIYTGIKKAVVERDREITNELQAVLKDVRENATIENSEKLMVFSKKVMNLENSFYGGNENLPSDCLLLYGLSSDIIKNISNDEELSKLLIDYENTLDSVFSEIN